MATRIGGIVVDIDARLARLESSLNKANRKLGQFDRRAKEQASGIERTFKRVGLAAAGMLAGFSFVNFSREMVKVTTDFRRFEKTLMTATGSSAGVASAMGFIEATADRLGLRVRYLAESYGQLSAASRGTALEGQQTREIFEGINEAGVALGLSNEALRGTFKAVEQMISKGKVQAEELRGQLGERLPGAFQIAARAMGMTTAELSKSLEVGGVYTDEFLPKFIAQLRSEMPRGTEAAEAGFNRFMNAYDNALRTIGESDLFDQLSAGAEDLGDILKTMAKDGTFTNIGEGIAGIASAVRDAVSLFGLLGEQLDSINNHPISRWISGSLNQGLASARENGANLRGFLTSGNFGYLTGSRNQAREDELDRIQRGIVAAHKKNVDKAKEYGIYLDSWGGPGDFDITAPFGRPDPRGGGGGGGGDGKPRKLTAAEKEAIRLRKRDEERWASAALSNFNTRNENEQAGRFKDVRNEVKGLGVDLRSLVTPAEHVGSTLKNAFDFQLQNDIKLIGDYFERDLAAGLADMIVYGESLGDVLEGAFKRVTASILEAVIQAKILEPILDSLGSGRGGGGIFGDIGSFFGGLFSGGRALGGPVKAGHGYTVGENGPEQFIPRTAGMIIPNQGGGRVVVEVVAGEMFDVRVAQGAADIVRTVAPTIARAGSMRAQRDLSRPAAPGGGIG